VGLVERKHIGKTITCPKCGVARIKIEDPDDSPTVADIGVASSVASRQFATSKVKISRSPPLLPAASTGSTLWTMRNILIGASTLAILALMLVVAFDHFSDSNEEQKLAIANVDVVHHEVREKESLPTILETEQPKPSVPEKISTEVEIVENPLPPIPPPESHNDSPAGHNVMVGEEEINVLELHANARANETKVDEWYYYFSPAVGLPGGKVIGPSKGWMNGEPQSRPGSLFRITMGPATRKYPHVPALRISQIVGPRAFIDLVNKFYVEGLSTDGLVDESDFMDYELLLRQVGYFKGSKTYETAAGDSNTVLHIILADSGEQRSFPRNVEDMKNTPAKTASDPATMKVEASFRIWTKSGSDRTKSEGRIVRKYSSRIKLEDKQGRQYTVRISELSKEDQEYIKTWKPSPDLNND
jgi:hypothetical protein